MGKFRGSTCRVDRHSGAARDEEPGIDNHILYGRYLCQFCLTVAIDSGLGALQQLQSLSNQRWAVGRRLTSAPRSHRQQRGSWWGQVSLLVPGCKPFAAPIMVRSPGRSTQFAGLRSVVPSELDEDSVEFVEFGSSSCDFGGPFRTRAPAPAAARGACDPGGASSVPRSSFPFNLSVTLSRGHRSPPRPCRSGRC